MFKGEGQAVVDCCYLDARVWAALWPLCILQWGERETGSETSPPPADWMINDQRPVIDHCPNPWLIGQRDDNLCSLISTRQTMTDDRESDSALAAVTSKVTGALGCSRPAMSKLLFVCMGPCVSCVSTQVCVCVCSSFVICASCQLYCSSIAWSRMRACYIMNVNKP